MIAGTSSNVGAELPLVTHVVHVPGALTEAWIDAQVLSHERFQSELIAMQRPPFEPYWTAPARTIHSLDPLRVAYRLALRSPRGATLAAGIRAPFSRRRTAIFHAHFGTVAARCVPVARRIRRPLVASFYGFDASIKELMTPTWQQAYQNLFRNAAAVFIEGPAMQDRLVRLGCPPEKLLVLRLPLPQLDMPNARSAEAAPEFTAALPGRLVPKKGFDTGIRAFARAFPDGNEKLLVIGDGPERARLEGLATDVGLRHRVTFTGALPMQEFVRNLRTAAIAVFPSVTGPDGDAEGGAPTTLTLAQFLGIPVIVSDHDDLPWTSAPGTPVVPQGDVVDLADALTALWLSTLHRPTDVREQATRAQTFVRRQHDKDLLLNKREETYMSVLEGRALPTDAV